MNINNRISKEEKKNKNNKIKKIKRMENIIYMFNILSMLLKCRLTYGIDVQSTIYHYFERNI